MINREKCQKGYLTKVVDMKKLNEKQRNGGRRAIQKLRSKSSMK